MVKGGKKCNLFKCWRQEELLWVSADQEGLERNISAVWKTESGPASTKPALTIGPHSVTLYHLTLLDLFYSIYHCLKLPSLFIVLLFIIYFSLFWNVSSMRVLILFSRWPPDSQGLEQHLAYDRCHRRRINELMKPNASVSIFQGEDPNSILFCLFCADLKDEKLIKRRVTYLSWESMLCLRMWQGYAI